MQDKDNFFYTYYKRRGSSILFKYTKNGKKRSVTVKDYKPSLYFPAKPDEAESTSIYGEPLKKKKFDSIKEAAQFGKEYSEMGGSVVHGNRMFDNQFIIEMFEGQIPEYDSSKIDIGIIDIETDYDEFPDPQKCLYQVQQINVKNTGDNTHYSFGLKSYEHDMKDKDIGECVVVHTQFESEEDLLMGFVMHIQNMQYDLTSGWNSEEFDWPYLINRIRKVLGNSWANRLSPFGLIYEREVVNKYKNVTIKYDVVGLPHIDYMKAYEKHTYTPRESYKLDYILFCELGERKKDFSHIAKTLKQLWEKDPQTYIAYNIMDCEGIHRLDEKLGLFDLIFTLSYLTLSNYEDTLGTTKIWEQLIAKHLYNSNVAPIFKALDTPKREFEGAFVHPTQAGVHDWALSFDLDSLYPHIIQQVNIGPETIVPYHKLPDDVKALVHPTDMVGRLLDKKIDTSVLNKHNLSMAANGCFYRKDKKSFFSEIMESVYSDRVKYKKLMKQAKKKVQDGDKTYLDSVSKYDNMQMGLKIILNSGYGALGNAYFLYFMVDTAESITTTGQLVNKWCSYKTNDFLKDMFKNDTNYIISGDTDSFYLSVAPLGNNLVKKYDGDMDKVVDKLDEFCGIIDKKLHSYCDDLADYLNSSKQAMHWSREVIAEKAIMVAKKKYTMKVLDDEGLRVTKDPKYKIMGMESVKSSTPGWAKDLLVECYKIALNYDESVLHKKVDEFQKKFYSYPVEDIAIPSGVNNIAKYSDENKIYSKGTPKHVKGVLIHNWMIKQKGLKINPITKDGSKIKYVSLKKPNPINQEVVAFDGELPEEFGLHKYVNKKELFNKGFLDPLKLFLEVVDWTHEEVNTLI